MPYIANTPEDQRTMLEALGLASLEELFDAVPAELKLAGPLAIPPALAELELTAHMAALSARNQSAAQKVCFLGAGSYDHFVPAIVDAIASRGEFYTSYTPYQPEASQGNLQVFFEYQTLITQLTGMEVSNASLYDGGSAAAEAVLMAISSTGRHGRVVTARSVHPEYRQVLGTYLANLNVELVTVGAADGVIAPEELAHAVNGETACVLMQQPNFFGCLEDADELSAIAHRAGALLVASVDPISLGILKRPGDYGADIVVAEGQSLGSPMSFGGPYLGILACRESLVRRMPGRLVGETVDRRGRRCFVLTLQTREQHIRREKATSNICTNQGLFALRAAVYLAALGPQGLRETAELCLQKAHYLRKRLATVSGLSLPFARASFKEFVVRAPGHDVPALLEQTCESGFLAGVRLGRWYEELADCFLVTVTERRARSELDALVDCLSNLTAGRHA